IKLNDLGMLDIIAKELNIKNAQIVEDNSDLVGYEIKPQLKTIGPKYGKLLGGIREYLANCDANKVVSDVENGTHNCVINGVSVEFAKEDLLISTTSKAGMFSESDKGITITIDTNLTPELIEEGVARELVSKIQTMRKEAGFEVTDHINIGYIAEGLSADVLAKDKSILTDVLADSIKNAKIDGYSKEWNINGDNVTLFIAKV
ncbi:MAG: isoleucine--tRNA ligase, partial [Clostridia bacterium]|nr:isoleucine--tRNA ligase [Clostridia bacterium]